MKKISIVGIIILGLCVFAAGLVGLRTLLPTSAQEETHFLPGTLQVSGEYADWYQYEQKTDTYRVVAVYPAKTTLSPLADKKARQTIELALKKSVDEFMTESVARIDTQERERILARGTPYTHTVLPSKVALSEQYVSYVYETYWDTGGAHGTPGFMTFVFDKTGAQIAITDFFKADSGYLTYLSTESKRQVVEQMKVKSEGSLSDAEIQQSLFMEGMAPEAKNFSEFYLDGNNLIILFGPYQVAAYAAGSFEVTVPLNALRAFVR